MSYKIVDNQENETLAEEILYGITHGKTYDNFVEEKGKNKCFYYELMKFYKKKWQLSKVISFYDWLNHTGQLSSFCKDYTENNLTTMQVGKKYNISERTVVSILVKSGISIKSQGFPSKTLQDIFSNINTEIQAYTIGLITADGSITKDNRTCTICLAESDKYILEKINEELLGGTGKIFLIHQEDVKPRAVLRFHGKQICSDLNKFNIVPRKSYLLKSLSNYIPDNLYRHYIRGLYDGDGVCNLSNHKVRIGFCGHEYDFVEDYRNFLNKELNMPKNKLFNTGNCWQVSWSAKKDLINFYNYLYKDSSIFLGRKKKKLQNYLNF